jgi:1,4-dihydroxy-2-naphthoyl-CoA synthase
MTRSPPSWSGIGCIRRGSHRRRDRHHGNDKAFAAGADIAAMAEWDYQKVYADNYISRDWEDVRGQPVIAAVAGYALGGGCELAMMCDHRRRRHREVRPAGVTIGTMPGLGGTAPAARGGQVESDGLVPDRPHDRCR